jgi:succinyl-diaminopimelate desuccinylase
MEVEFTAQLPEKLIAFTAGSASNSVAGSAYALLPGNENQITTEDSGQYPGICVGHEGEYLCIKATGRSAHAASPEGSVNAAVILASYLVRSRLLDIESIRRLSFLSDCFADYYGKALEIDYENAEAGKLTVIAGKTCTRDGILRQNINIRYPAGTDVQEMTDRLAETAESYGWQMEIIRNDPPAYVSPHHPIVQALDGICKDYFGSRTGPYAMGGGTYARKLPNAVAFGPSIRGMKKPGLPGHGGGHQPDECVWIQGLQTAVSIYVQALIKIDGMLCGKNQ